MTSTDVLKKYGLNKTSGRVEILNVLITTETALSEKEIQEKLGNLCDRATVYRTLRTFVENGIIHPVATEAMVTKYVIKKKPDDHLHFSCTECGKTICLTDIVMSDFNLPEGFIKKNSNFLIIGTCNECNN
ncbi:MAG: transcriptional repressor [Bacteroidales bacterium]|nr:transcriptional repressor [Bacteroidales bacterium]